jgi:hypothetical protein
MEYIIVHKELRPAGDWLITAESEEGKVFHVTFASEPTATEVNELAIERAAKAVAAQAKEAERKEMEEAMLAQDKADQEEEEAAANAQN